MNYFAQRRRQEVNLACVFSLPAQPPTGGSVSAGPPVGGWGASPALAAAEKEAVVYDVVGAERAFLSGPSFHGGRRGWEAPAI